VAKLTTRGLVATAGGLVLLGVVLALALTHGTDPTARRAVGRDDLSRAVVSGVRTQAIGFAIPTGPASGPSG
jgi:hypothetical protein